MNRRPKHTAEAVEGAVREMNKRLKKMNKKPSKGKKGYLWYMDKDFVFNRLDGMIEEVSKKYDVKPSHIKAIGQWVGIAGKLTPHERPRFYGLSGDGFYDFKREDYKFMNHKR